MRVGSGGGGYGMGMQVVMMGGKAQRGLGELPSCWGGVYAKTGSYNKSLGLDEASEGICRRGAAYQVVISLPGSCTVYIYEVVRNALAFVADLQRL
jgi:hypothetical protein